MNNKIDNSTLDSILDITLNKVKYYILTASLDHILLGLENKFIQQHHPNRIEKIKKRDYIILYSSKHIIAICQARNNVYLTFKNIKTFYRRDVVIVKTFYNSLSDNLKLVNNNVNNNVNKGLGHKQNIFLNFPIVSILSKLKFLRNKKLTQTSTQTNNNIQNKIQTSTKLYDPHWGMYFMSGFREIDYDDFKVIYDHM
jgi:hypothetical protein